MGSLFLTDEELGKKDDDHKPAKLPLRAQYWNPARVATRKSLKRLAIALALGLCVYLFIRNIPTDVPIHDRRRPVYNHPDGTYPLQPPYATGGLTAPKTDSQGTPRPPHSVYNGPPRFLNLGASLQAISTTRGAFLSNKNVLFAASSLKSVAALLPLACQMGSELRNYVHFALMSRSEIDFEQLRTINGIDDSCQVIFHDARPDHSSISSEARLETCTGRALHHIHSYMHPQAIIVDGSSTEEEYFLRAMRKKADDEGMPLVELPEFAPNKLAWVTKLDSASLAAWNKLNVEILIQAPSGGSGSLIRLLRSLSHADFIACPIPHLTIDLPHELDQFTAKYLKEFQWPPAHVHNPQRINQLSLRRRIPRHDLSAEESSVRFLESFWPTNPSDSHILVLSPQVELSPRFFHYLQYTLLEYVYSNAAVLQEWDKRLLGISLDLPSTYLNASQPFSPPTKREALPSALVGTNEPTSFLWQAPNSNAVLILGHKWVELHGFVSRLVDLQHWSPSTASTPVVSEKFISKRYPAWLEHALKLSRARGYWTLYPSAMTASNLATIHNDLYRQPEEYKDAADKAHPADATEIILKDAPLLDRLPDGGDLPPFGRMPLLTWDGEVTTLRDFDAAASSYAKKFQGAIGGCEDLLASDLMPRKSAADLFCEKED